MACRRLASQLAVNHRRARRSRRNASACLHGCRDPIACALNPTAAAAPRWQHRPVSSNMAARSSDPGAASGACLPCPTYGAIRRRGDSWGRPPARRTRPREERRNITSTPGNRNDVVGKSLSSASQDDVAPLLAIGAAGPSPENCFYPPAGRYHRPVERDAMAASDRADARAGERGHAADVAMRRAGS